MIETVVDGADDRVLRTFGLVGGGKEVAIIESGQDLFELLGIAFAPFAEPPDGTFADDGEGHHADDGDRVHDRAAFGEHLNEHIGKHHNSLYGSCFWIVRLDCWLLVLD